MALAVIVSCLLFSIQAFASRRSPVTDRGDAWAHRVFILRHGESMANIYLGGAMYPWADPALSGRLGEVGTGRDMAYRAGEIFAASLTKANETGKQVAFPKVVVLSPLLRCLESFKFFALGANLSIGDCESRGPAADRCVETVVLDPMIREIGNRPENRGTPPGKWSEQAPFDDPEYFPWLQPDAFEKRQTRWWTSCDGSKDEKYWEETAHVTSPKRCFEYEADSAFWRAHSRELRCAMEHFSKSSSVLMFSHSCLMQFTGEYYNKDGSTLDVQNLNQAKYSGASVVFEVMRKDISARASRASAPLQMAALWDPVEVTKDILTAEHYILTFWQGGHEQRDMVTFAPEIVELQRRLFVMREPHARVAKTFGRPSKSPGLVRLDEIVGSVTSRSVVRLMTAPSASGLPSLDYLSPLSLAFFHGWQLVKVYLEYKGRGERITESIWQKLNAFYGQSDSLGIVAHRRVKSVKLFIAPNHKETFLVQVPTKSYLPGQKLITLNFLRHRNAKIESAVLRALGKLHKTIYASPKNDTALTDGRVEAAFSFLDAYVENVAMEEYTDETNAYSFQNSQLHFNAMVHFLVKEGHVGESVIGKNSFFRSSDPDMMHLQYMPNLRLPVFNVHGKDREVRVCTADGADKSRILFLLQASGKKWPIDMFRLTFLESDFRQGRIQPYLWELQATTIAFRDQPEFKDHVHIHYMAHRSTGADGIDTRARAFARSDDDVVLGEPVLSMYLILEKATGEVELNGFDPQKVRPGWLEAAGFFMDGSAQAQAFSFAENAETYYSPFRVAPDIALVFEEMLFHGRYHRC
eukprot:TRINITY_DN15696_c0_g1_i1.p1 TRINITY_DN15696_c0_g1~~TRINITY_DN15696_c0_g1_i1.p1  ORF type:complete len:808 (-),score=78.53 TRINITY_DN15696_c0_g1_i1:167-2590(-)